MPELQSFYDSVTASMDKERATDVSTSVWPLTWYPIIRFSPNWKDMDLMGGLFNGQGTDYEIVSRQWWSMAQCLDGDQ